MKYFILAFAAVFLLGAPVAAIAGGHHNWFEKADTNADGELSKEEFLSSKAAKFDKMDTDGNGVLTKEERGAVKAKVKEKMEERRAKMKENRSDHDY